MTGRDIRRAGINKFTIYFVREEEEVVLLHQVTDLIHFPTCIQITGRVVRITNQDSLGTFIDQFLEFLYFRQGETFFNGRCNRTDLCSGRDGKCHVVGVCRFRNNDFISRIQAGKEGKKYRFRTSRCNDYIVSRQVDVELCIISHKFLAIASVSGTGAIFQHFTVDVAYRVNRGLRSGQIRLSDVQVKHMDSALLGSVCQRSQFSDRRCRHLVSANGYGWHNFNYKLLITIYFFNLELQMYAII